MIPEPPGEIECGLPGSGGARESRLAQLLEQLAQLGPWLDLKLARQLVAAYRRLGAPRRAPVERLAHQLASQLEVGGDGGLGVLAARGQAVRAREKRDLDLHRGRAVEVAVDHLARQRARVDQEAEHQVMAGEPLEEAAQ